MHPVLLSAWISLTSPPGDLAALEARARNLPVAWTSERWQAVAGIRVDLLRLLEADQLHTAEALRLAAWLSHPTVEHFPACRQHYELMLAAAALGDERAAQSLGGAWDVFITATGRRPRTILSKGPAYAEGYVPVPTVAVVRGVLTKPVASRAKAALLPPHPLLKRMWEADQKARKQNWKTMTGNQREAAVWAWWRRRRALRKLLDRVPLLCASDFGRGAQVMQPGNWFEDNALAHELAVCGMVLDPGAGPGIVAETYDRLLWTMGQPQRLGTQHHDFGAPVTTDPSGFNDTLRKALGQPPRGRN